MISNWNTQTVKVAIKAEPTVKEDATSSAIINSENDHKTEADEDDDIDDDIVIISRPKLNLPPVQYSKQYYDLNMNGLEIELRRFLASPSPPTSSSIASVTKSPLKMSKSAEMAALATSAIASTTGAGSRRLKQHIRQR